MSFYKGKVVWITGASSGIGKEMACQLAALGARLILTARNEEKLNEVRKYCESIGADCQLLTADLTKTEILSHVTEQSVKLYGHIDILVNNAGISQRSLAAETPVSIDRYIMELDFFAPVTLTKLLLPHFKERRSGQIVVIGSMAGLMGFPYRSAYAAAKHALHGFFETLQVEHSIPGFFITVVSPGRIQTPISLSAITANGGIHGEMDEGQLNGIPVQRCVEKILRSTASRKRHLMIANGERVLLWIKWYLPGWYYRIARNEGLK